MVGKFLIGSMKLSHFFYKDPFFPRLEFADLREAAGKSEFSSTIPLSEREIRTVFLKNAEKFSNVAFDKAAEIVHAVVPV